MTVAKVTARVALAIECVPEDTKRFVADVKAEKEQLRAQRAAKLARIDAAKRPAPPKLITHTA